MAEQIISASGTQYGAVINSDGSLFTRAVLYATSGAGTVPVACTAEGFIITAASGL